MEIKGTLIAHCGLDCSKCEAFIATQNDDDALRRKVAAEWSALNHVEITAEMINCDGCREEGRKTPFCRSLCEIRSCAKAKGIRMCSGCKGWEKCPKLSMIKDHSEEALSNLTKFSS